MYTLPDVKQDQTRSIICEAAIICWRRKITTTKWDDPNPNNGCSIQKRHREGREERARLYRPIQGRADKLKTKNSRFLFFLFFFSFGWNIPIDVLNFGWSLDVLYVKTSIKMGLLISVQNSGSLLSNSALFNPILKWKIIKKEKGRKEKRKK